MTETEAKEKKMGESDTNEVSSDDDDKKNGQSSGTKRPASTSEDDKKAERRAANRRSAFQSRQRRKILIEDLQRTVSALSNENTDLRKSNEDLRVQLEATLLENHQFRMQQQLGGSQGGAGGLLGASALQSAQAQALLRGQGGQAAIAQLLGPAAGASSLGTAGAAPKSGDNDPLLNARLALAAAQTRVGDLEQSQGSGSGKGTTPGSPNHGAVESPNPNAGIQGILDAASMARAAGNAGGQLGALQGLLQGGAAAGAASQLSGLQGLLEARGQAAAPAGASAAGSQLAGLQGLLGSLGRGAAAQQPAGLTDIQRAILQGAGGAGAGVVPNLQLAKNSQDGNNASISDALRNLLQRNQSS